MKDSKENAQALKKKSYTKTDTKKVLERIHSMSEKDFNALKEDIKPNLDN